MKNLLLPIAMVLGLSVSTTTLFSQSVNLDGDWAFEANGEKQVMLISGNYCMLGVYDMANGSFKAASGGKTEIKASSIQFEVEFNSADKNDVGSFHLYDYMRKGDMLETKHHEEVKAWKKLDAGIQTPLTGTWLFSGRKVADTLQPFTPGVRKTMKMLTGSRFQWAAFNTETKEFFGTSGGTYTAKDGKYAETIEFFSRDNTRVGATLRFDFTVNPPHWMHSGLSSKGEPINERWSWRSSFKGQ